VDFSREAVGAVDFVGFRVAVLECRGDAGAPAALCVTGMHKDSVWRCREDVADVVGEAEVR